MGYTPVVCTDKTSRSMGERGGRSMSVDSDSSSSLRTCVMVCLAVSLGAVSVWLLNVTAYPSFNDFFPGARDVATTFSGVCALLFSVIAARRPLLFTGSRDVCGWHGDDRAGLLRSVPRLLAAKRRLGFAVRVSQVGRCACVLCVHEPCAHEAGTAALCHGARVRLSGEVCVCRVAHACPARRAGRCLRPDAGRGDGPDICMRQGVPRGAAPDGITGRPSA